MEEGAIYRPSYKSLHRDMVKRRNDCEKTLARLKKKDGVYANEIRRCQKMLVRVVDAIEQDCP